MTADAARVAEARRWFRRLGYLPVEHGDVTVVTTPAHPDSWEANWAQPSPGADAAAVSAALMEVRASDTRWQVVAIDCLCDPAVEAALALADFGAGGSVIEMLAQGAITSPHPLPPVELCAVDADSWASFAALVGGDPPAAGLLDGMRRRRGPCTYWLLRAEEEVVGYGMTAVCPNGLGLIEHLFTVAERRGRGLMSAFIVAAAARLRAAGCDGIFLDAHAHDAPKHLYRRLGFAPVAVTRTWVRRLH